jgi:hypothetical protein
MSAYPSWDEHLRIGDTEREQAAAALGEHYAQGRLTTEEHSERLDRIWAAKTRSELAPVFTDLPGPGAPRPAHPRQFAPPRTAFPAARRRRRFPLPLVVLFAILVTVTVITNLPLILIGVGVWFLLTRCAGAGSRSHRYQQHRPQARY